VNLSFSVYFQFSEFGGLFWFIWTWLSLFCIIGARRHPLLFYWTWRPSLSYGRPPLFIVIAALFSYSQPVFVIFALQPAILEASALQYTILVASALQPAILAASASTCDHGSLSSSACYLGGLSSTACDRCGLRSQFFNLRS
jgi:hypothetical protein